MSHRGARRRRVRIRLWSYLTAACVCMGIFGYIQYTNAQYYRRMVETGYQHAFQELVTAVSEMDVALQKSLYATSPSMIGAVCTQVFGKAMTAQMSLGVLPFGSQDLEQTSGFISRVGDYAFAVSRSAPANGGYSEEEYANLKALSETAGLLALNMKNLQLDLNDGVLTMDAIVTPRQQLYEGIEAQAGALSSSVQLIEQEFPELPSLVYDGPFSEHIQTRQPVFLEGLEDVDEAAAIQAAADFTGVRPERLRLLGTSEGDLPCYYLESESGAATIVVTRQGGKVVHYLTARQPHSGDLTDDQATAIACRFLESRGYPNMASTYLIRQNHVVMLNFAYKQGDVLCYSDLIKVGIAEDTGAICHFEAQGYFMTHHERELEAPAITAEEAAAQLPPDLTLQGVKLALVPSDGLYERLCWELTCVDEDARHCLLYIRADTGEQEKILILLEDETGTLTI